MLKRIAVLTSGGDSPGMNAAIRAVVRVALHEGVETWGVSYGYSGLVGDWMVRLESRSVGDILQRGGTILGTARCDEFRTAEGRAHALDNLKRRNIDGLVVIGGDGSLTGARLLAAEGFPVVGLPGTIDNDLWGTDYTIGFDTTVNTVVDAINKLRDTASAHRRVIVVEVMGRQSGWIALTAGLAGGAEEILVPEVPADLGKTIAKLKRSCEAGKRYNIVVVAEGVSNTAELARRIEDETGMETRLSILGHIQRGGAPSVFDRILASSLAEKAVMALLAGGSNAMFGYQRGTVVPVNLDDVIRNRKELDAERFRLAHLLA